MLAPSSSKNLRAIISGRLQALSLEGRHLCQRTWLRTLRSLPRFITPLRLILAYIYINTLELTILWWFSIPLGSLLLLWMYASSFWITFLCWLAVTEATEMKERRLTSSARD
jgi:hypothetical protein